MKRWWIVAGAAATVGTAPLVAQGGGREAAGFAGGCVWGGDAVFRHGRGVLQVVSGYAGGDAATARYELVSTSTTGHAESVEVTYDAATVSYAQLLRVFFTVAHDPTQRDRQGPDVGTPYRSAPFYPRPAQRHAAVAMLTPLQRGHVLAVGRELEGPRERSHGRVVRPVQHVQVRQLGHGGHVARVLLNRADQRILHLGQQLQLGKRERVERRRGGPPGDPGGRARVGRDDLMTGEGDHGRVSGDQDGGQGAHALLRVRVRSRWRSRAR